MDGGFKKLWSRKKSWGTSDQPARPRRLSSSNANHVASQINTSTIKDGRPSMASSRQVESSYSRERPGGSRDLTQVTSIEESGRTKSGHRIQPMLVGISRPETGNARPDTAGSLQTAVQRAADAVEPRASDVARAPPVQTKTNLKGKPVSRHIDIFAVAASVPAYQARYNEDIAERNLDNYRLVLENTPYVYDPSSKYQEEVAIRNAYLPYKSRPSTDTLRRPMDQDRNASMTSKSVRSVVSPQPAPSHSHNLSADSTGSMSRMSQDQVNSYFHQFNQRPLEGPQLPPIPQEYRDGGTRTQEDEYTIITKPPYSPPRTIGLINNIARDGRMQTIQEGQLYEMRPPSATRPPPSRDSEYASNNVTYDYALSAAEYGNRNSGNRPAVNDRSYNPQQSADALFGPPSARSTASSLLRTIVLPNRTIMDLTNEDSSLISETSSAYNSPVIEQAKSDAFRRVMPSQIRTEERRGSKEPFLSTETPTATVHVSRQPFSSIETPTATITTPTATITTVHVQTPAVQEDEPLVIDLPADVKQQLSYAFSPINTVASWSPRSSTYVMNILNSTEPASMTARVTAALEASKSVAKDEVQPVSVTRGDETPTVRERVATFETSVERSTSPQITVTDTHTNGARPKTIQVTPTVSKSNTSASAPRNGTATTTRPKESISNGPSKYISPSSISVNNFVDPSAISGVRTRDFALSPRASAQLPVKESTPTKSPQLGTKSTNTKVEGKLGTAKPRAKSSVAGATKPLDGGFDEEAFKRKQADARAALERLQRSLSEDFMTLPDRSTLKSYKGKEVEADSRSSAAAVVQSTESRNSIPNSTIPRIDTERPPPSSFRNSRGEQQRASLNSNRSLSTGSRSSRRAPAPSGLKNVEPATNPINHNLLSPALLQALQMSSNPPKSPGEISLSSFPVPSSSRPPSQPDVPAGFHTNTTSFAGIMKRRNSNKSQASTASVFSIPLHMVPGRVSSVRDPVPEEVDSAYA